LRFDLSPVPAGATIEEATLTVFSFWMEEIAHDGLACTALTSDWDVETAESNFPTFDDAPYEQIGDDPEETMLVYDVTATIEEIVEFGEPNYGFMMYFPLGEPTHESYVISCDNYDPYGRPKLTVTYTDPS
jgi:hypothetical protein